MEETGRREWIETQGFDVARLEPLAGDVSQRQYYRAYLGAHLASPATAILATYPPEIRESCRRFEISTRLLELRNVRVPRILARDCDRGLALLEDVGPLTLYDLADRDWSELAPHLFAAVEMIGSIQTVPADVVEELNPPLDGALLRRELAQTRELLLDEPPLRAPTAERRRLRETLDALCERLAAGPTAVCHRDFMARNLVPLDGGGLAVLDHQDLRIGPAHYDLASLLNDSLFVPPELERELLDAYGVLGKDRDENGDADLDLYRACAAQRTLKAAGTFAAFARRGFSRHLPLIPPTLARAAAHLRQLPEGAELPEELFESWERYGQTE